MLLATIFFVIGKPFYTMKEPEGNITGKVVGSIARATHKKFTRLNPRSLPPRADQFTYENVSYRLLPAV